MGWIYFIESGSSGRVKIGYTTDVRKRLQKLQTASSEPLILIGVQPGTPEAEKALHERFEAYQIRGEWFYLTRDISQYIAANCEEDDRPDLRRLRHFGKNHP